MNALNRVFGAMLILAVGFVGLSGCGGQPGATVSGKVSFKGDPVTGGGLTFSPAAAGADVGRSEYAAIASDGTYQIKIAQGEQRVSFTSPPRTDAGEADPTNADARVNPGTPSPYEGLSPKQPVVKVTSNSMVVDIELVK